MKALQHLSFLSASRGTAALLLLTVWCLPIWSQYSLDSFTIGPGEVVTNATYALEVTIGETESPTLTGGPYTLEAGFSAVIAIQTPDTPLLTVQNSTNNTVIVSWPAAIDEFELQQSSDLSEQDWTTAPQPAVITGDNRFIIVHPPSGHLFFRLRKTESIQSSTKNED